MYGFDIGTTQSKVSYVDQGGQPMMVLNDRGEHCTRSSVWIPESGPPLFGSAANEQGYLHPGRLASNFKLDLARPGSVVTEGPDVSAVEVTALLVGHLKDLAERTTGKAVDECVATCPANYLDDNKQALLDAFQLSGINVQRLIPEPTAATIAYSVNKQRDARTLVTYDFGGGTFDVTVSKTHGEEVTVLATDGEHQLGGNDLNHCLRERLLDELAAKCGQRPSVNDDPLFAYDLEQRVEQAKISLATRPQVPVVVAYNGTQLICEITQNEFHQLIAPLVTRTLEAVDRAIAGAGLSTDQIDHLIMVGGTSRLPYIQSAVAQHTGLAPKTDVDPEKAIAYGAALASLSELARQGRHATIRGQVIPAPDMFIREVTAHPVGCCVVDGSSSSRRLSNSVIIPQNTAIPCRKTDRFFLEHDDQREARIEILQGAADANRDDCLLIGELFLDELPEEDKATARIQVEYIIDGNGMVTATATDLVSSKEQTVSVDYKKGIKAREKPAAA